MKISPKQRDFYLHSKAKINILQGAVRSGKSYIACWRFINEIAQDDADYHEYCIICVTIDAFIRNIYVILRQILGARFAWSPGKRQILLDGKKIHVIGASDERAEQKIRGPTFHGAFVDEATIIPESAWRMLVSRCAMGNAKIFATTNPDSSFHWLYTDFIQDNEDVKTWKFNFNDNPILTQEEKVYLERQYRGLWYKRFILGEWVQAEGAVYDFFDEKIHLIDNAPSYAKYFLVGVDYGISNPTSFVMVGFNDESPVKLWVEKEYYYDCKKMMKQKTDAELLDDLVRFCEGYPVKTLYVDPSALSFIVECRRNKLPVKQAKNEVLPGIAFVSTLISAGDLKILKSNRHLINEIHSYVWDEKAQTRGIDQPKKQMDHALDAMRYAVYSHYGHKKDLQESIENERSQFQKLHPMHPNSWGPGWEVYNG